jgi:hypothetical protein
MTLLVLPAGVPPLNHGTGIMYRTLGTMVLTTAVLLAADSAEAQIAVKMAVGGPVAIAPAAATTTTETAAANTNSDEELLRSVGIPSDGPGLVAYFRLRSQGEAKAERLAELS